MDPRTEDKRRNVTSMSVLIQCLNWHLRKTWCASFFPSTKLPVQLCMSARAGSTSEAPRGLRLGLYLALLVKQSTGCLPQQLVWELPVPVPPAEASASSCPGKGDGNLRPALPNHKESVGRLPVHMQREIRKYDIQSRTGAALFSE